MPNVTANGINIHYEEKGSGDPVLCLMGITAPGGVWEPHVEEWQKHYRCLMPDNRGVGLSDKPEGPYTSEMMADDMAAFLDALSIPRVHVVGCSMGSIIAQQLALRHPDKVSSAILMCTWARCDAYAKGIFEQMKILKARLTPEEFMLHVQLLIFSKTFWDSQADGLDEGRKDASLNPLPQPVHGLEAQAHACTNHNTLDQLSSIQAPCLVIGGKDDIFTPLWMAQEVHEALPKSELFLFDHAGHGFHFEHMDAFNAKTTDWLKSQSL